MGKRKILRWLIIAAALGTVIAASLLLFHAKSTASPNQDLIVVSATPVGTIEDISETNQIQVSFGSPMVPLGTTTARRVPMRILPRASGTFRWLGTSTLIFEPSPRLPLATRYEVTIKKGTRALDGKVLPHDYTWHFETLLPKMITTYPENEARWVDPGSPLLVIFNQPVDLDRISNFVKLHESGGKEIPIKIVYPKPDLWKKVRIKPSSRGIAVLPASALDKGAKYILHLLPGLPGREGTLGMEKEEDISFSTWGPLAYTGTDRISIDPDEGLTIAFNNPVKCGNVVKSLSITPDVGKPKDVCQGNYYSEAPQLRLPLQAEKSYSLTLKSGLTDQFGEKLSKPVSIHVAVNPYPPFAQMTTGYGVLESDQPLLYPIWIRNAPEVGLEMALLSPDEVIPFVKKLRGDQQECCEGGNFESDKPLQVQAGFWGVSRSLTFSQAKVKKTFPIPVSEIFGKKPQHGIVLLQVNTLPAYKQVPSKKPQGSIYQRALILCTGLGITGKFSADSDLIWVTRMHDSSPVPDADVEIRDQDNKVLWNGKTNQEGFVQTPGWKKLGMTIPKNSWKSPVQYVLVRSETDTAFSSSEWGTGIYPYEFGIDYDWDPYPQETAGYLFPERPLYRQGENVRLKGIVREKELGNWIIPKNKTVNLRITDPRGEVFLDKKGISLSDWGSFDQTINLPQNAVTGTYDVRGSFKPLTTESEYDRNVFSTSFDIAAYRPISFKVNAKADKKSYFPGEIIHVNSDARYLFGAPLSGEKISWSWTKSFAFFAPQGKEGYAFGSPYEEEEGESSIGSGSGVLSKDGLARINKKIARGKDTTPLFYGLSVTARGSDRQEVSSNIEVLVHPAYFYAGIHLQSIFAREGEPFKLAILACTPEGANLPGKKLKLSLIRQEWVSARKAGFGGRYEWVSEKKETTESSTTVITSSDPVIREVRPNTTGYYLLKLEGNDDEGNPVRTTTYFYSTGSSFTAWHEEEDDRIELVADKKIYQPGETARILVKSPYPDCKALVTAEREGIISTWTAALRGSTPEIDLPVSEKLIPNVFVGVVLVHGRANQPGNSSNDLGKPSFKIGYVNLNIDSKPKHLHITLFPGKKTYRPGETAFVKVQVKDINGKGKPAEVTLAAVDEGVLALVAAETPDPFGTFYGSRPLSVQTSETRLHVVGQRHYGEKGESTGGGGGLSSGNFLRGHFETTCYWSPSVHTDSNGMATVQFKLPDNLTTFRIMGIAQALDSSFGSGDAQIKVSKPLVLLPDLPRFARTGDSFEAGVVINNNSGTPSKVLVHGSGSGIIQKGARDREVFVHAGESTEIRFLFEAKKPGKATFIFKARMGKETDGLLLSIPVAAPVASEYLATSGNSENEEQTEWLKVPSNARSDTGGLEVSLSSTALLELKGAARYLFEYPYGCFEQRTSLILPLVFGSDIMESFGLSVFQGESARKVAQREISNLVRFQTEHGGFSLWPGGNVDYPYLTAYGVFLLEEAGKRGYHVDKKMLEKAKNYLKQEAKGFVKAANYPYNPSEWDTIDTFTLYALSKSGWKNPGTVERLYQKRHELSYFSLAFLYKLMASENADPDKKGEIRRILENGLKISPTSAHIEEPHEEPWNYSSNDRTTAAVLQAFLEVDGGHPMAGKMVSWLLSKKQNGYWHNTEDNAFVLWALSDYFSKYEHESPNFKAYVLLREKEILQSEFTGRSLKQLRANVPINHLPKGINLPLIFQKKGDGRLYYELRMRYSPVGNPPPVDQGFSISKYFETLDGKKINPDKVSAGEILRVVLKVDSKEDRRNVALVDMLPAGFEPIETRFATEKRHLNANRRGEEWWWSGFYYSERYDDHLFFSSDWLERGTHTISYLTRATGIGSFVLPGAHVEEMYSPEVFGLSNSLRVIVRP